MHKDLGRDEYYGQNHKEPFNPSNPVQIHPKIKQIFNSSSKLLKKAGQHVI